MWLRDFKLNEKKKNLFSNLDKFKGKGIEIEGKLDTYDGYKYGMKYTLIDCEITNVW